MIIALHNAFCTLTRMYIPNYQKKSNLILKPIINKTNQEYKMVIKQIINSNTENFFHK